MTNNIKNNKTTDIVRWFLLLPVLFACLVIGYVAEAELIECLHHYFGLNFGLHFSAVLPGIFMVCGARVLLPKHRTLATWIAVVLWLIFVVGMSMLVHEKMLELAYINNLNS